MFKLWVVAVCILTVACATARVATFGDVVFEVIDAQTQEPIPNARIMVYLDPGGYLLNEGKHPLNQYG